MKMSDELTAVNVGERVTTLLLAVKLLDTVTGDPPTGNPRVRLGRSDAKPIVKPNGYYLFLAHEPIDDSIRVNVDAGERYQNESIEVDLSARDPRDPLEIELSPTASYEFPTGTTAVRGHILDGDGCQMDGAHVSTRNLERAIETDETGEFALFFGRSSEITAERTDDGVRVVSVDGEYPTIEVRESEASDRLTSVTLDGTDYPRVVEGAVTTFTIRLD